MRSAFRWHLFPGLLAGLALALLPRPILAQAKNKDKDKDEDRDRVKFSTFDEAELHGYFYSGKGRGRKAPAVLMLHELGGNCQQTGWDELAHKLQDEGFAVLAFDFRGHGKSTSVGKMFWSYRQNQGVRGFNAGNPRSEIAYKDFPANYYVTLVNDIEAAKRFLDEQNDAGLCNSSDLILVGAKDGATLGLMWAAHSFLNPRLGKNAFGGRGFPKGIEGEDLTCCVWLSVSPTIPAHGAIKGVSGANMPVQGWLVTPNAFTRNETLRDKVPMYLITNPAGTNYCRQLHNVLKNGKGKITQYDYVKTLDDAKNLSGRDLLGKSLNAEKFIVGYVKKVTEDGGKGWKDKDSKNRQPLGPVSLRGVLGGGY